MKLLTTALKNNVLASMLVLLDQKRSDILRENQKDLSEFDPTDRAMYDRLVIDDHKIDGMIQSVREVLEQHDPINQLIHEYVRPDGLRMENRTAPFGTILIIYESRPDVTIEAAVVAFKSNNKILLKGGKEALNSNKILVACWHKALEENGLDKDWITLMTTNRQETQAFLQNPTTTIDLIVPRGGEGLINFVKEYAKCPVLISGRGNNFLFVDQSADWTKTKAVILNAKTQKISACNALDKVLFHSQMPHLENRIRDICDILKDANVEVLVEGLENVFIEGIRRFSDEDLWREEFLAMKICIGIVDSVESAIYKINQHSGGHSNGIMTEDQSKAHEFMSQVDAAAIYHNASTRFTDGGQMGAGAELAISTDKLHHRGPLGLEQLVTNKYYVYGNGHVRV